jgi:hypothetical protein
MKARIALPEAPAPEAVSALGLGMRGGPRGRRWSWRGTVPPAVDIA